jgi:hypothetical protein
MSYVKTKVLILGLLVLIIPACESDPVGKTSPVKGKVTVEGKSLSTGSVTFFPDTAKGNKLAFTPGGKIGDDGSYEMFTNGKKGVPPGHYKVTVMAKTEADSTSPTKAKLLVPEAVTNEKTTTLLIEVIDDASKTYDLTVK